MSKTSDILFEFLRKVFYDPSGATLDIESLDEDFVMLGKGLMYFALCFSQYNELAMALSKGDLGVSLPPPENELSAPLKSLHASLRHLTWQSQQVANGDYKQRVDFMGDFSDAFNMMIEQLAERQQKLEDEIELSRNKTVALEQSIELLSNITQSIPQQIIVIDRNTHKTLFKNKSAQTQIMNDSNYIENMLSQITDKDAINNRQNIEILYTGVDNDEERYLSVSSYLLEWNNSDAEAFVINDISIEKNQIKELEKYAFKDSMTRLHNRFSGMIILNSWLEEKKCFSLVFVDLDNLKYVNDQFGHSEGDNYIITVAKYLRMVSSDAVACRIGGDEFMLLIPKFTYDKTLSHMNDLYSMIRKDNSLQSGRFTYSISYGIVYVEKNNKLPSRDILSLADSRMYDCKRERKKERGQITP